MLPLSILAPAIPGYTVMVCRMTGTVVAVDCGGQVSEDAPTPASHDRGWAAASCCDVLRVAFDRAPAESTPDQPALVLLGGHALPVGRSVPSPLALGRAEDGRAAAPPGLGPSRRLITQSFLI